MEDSGADGYLNCGSLDQKVSEEKNFNMLPRNHSHDILVKNVTAFYHCLKCLPEDKVERLRLCALAKEIPKQPTMYRLSPRFTLMKSILIKHSKLRQENAWVKE